MLNGGEASLTIATIKFTQLMLILTVVFIHKFSPILRILLPTIVFKGNRFG